MVDEQHSMPIRYGMVGGGEGAFIGAVHRLAARLDDHYRLVAGAFSSDPARSARSAVSLGLDEARGYANVEALIQGERARPDGMEVALIVTPNHLHYESAARLIEAGFHVICDKPVTTSVAGAERLAALVSKHRVLFMVTYNYSGYAMVREARALVAAGRLGSIRLVQVEYPQDWLSRPLEAEGQKQAAWRTDPNRAGPGGSLGDIGCHAFHLAEYVSGQRVASILADLTAFVAGRTLDDNAQVLLRFESGARGALWASQVAIGNNNGLRLRVYGEDGGLEWLQEQPERLQFTRHGEAPVVLERGGAGCSEAVNALSRLPGGHPEGFVEGFANLYSGFAGAVRFCRAAGSNALPTELPSIEEGIRGIRFIEQAVASAKQGNVWKALE